METDFRPIATAKSPSITYLDLEDFDVPSAKDIEDAEKFNALKRNRPRRSCGRIPLKGRASKYKGVGKRIVNKKYYYWQTVICSKHGVCFLGSYPYTPEGEKDAARAYDKAALELWGEDALTNQEYYGDLD